MTDRPDAAAVEALEAVYERLPRIRCRRRCWDSCGPIGMSPLERQRVIEYSGEDIPPGIVFSENLVQKCPALSRTHRCKIYAVRPMICRIWGLTENWKCGYGCVPEGGYLSEEDAWLLINRAAQIGGASFALPEDQLRRRLRSGEMAVAVAAVAAMNQLGYVPGVRR